MEALTDNERKILRLILSEPDHQLRPSDLVRKTNLSPRKVRTALKNLQGRALISRKPDFQDLRSYYYYPTDQAAVAEQGA